MVKSKEEVIAQFNEEVNMTAEELEAWLEDPKSTKAGTGVGVESGHKIVEILKKNPTKDPEKYDDEDIEHMRKVVGYNNRHLAQEDHLKETKTREELEDTKSTISLKNWGHDPVKSLDEENGKDPSTDSAANGDNNSHDELEAPDGVGESQPPDECANVDETLEVSNEVEEKPAESKKRKLGAEEPKDEETVAERETSAAASGEGEGEFEGEASGEFSEKDDKESDEDEPPRKKMKNDDV